MWPDVVDLRDFYASSLGRMVRRVVRARVRAYWADVTGANVLGVGFATPYLLPFCDEAARVVAVMPSRMGVMAWPGPGNEATEGNVACLSREAALPLPDRSVDRVLMVHGLEYTEQVSGLLREIWRVLADGGRLIVIVPNRRGFWARSDHTPFGHGHPYSLDQLNRILRQAMFTPERNTRALFIPPTRRRFWIAIAGAWERIGQRWFSLLGGVVIVEASKQIYAPRPVREGARRRVYVSAPEPAIPAARSRGTG